MTQCREAGPDPCTLHTSEIYIIYWTYFTNLFLYLIPLIDLFNYSVLSVKYGICFALHIIVTEFCNQSHEILLRNLSL